MINSSDTVNKIPADIMENKAWIALFSLNMQNFLEAMFDEIKRAGFSNIEFLEKSELFLTSITPEYEKENFDILLMVLLDIDQNFKQSKFYYSLNLLRKICNNDNLSVIINEIGINPNAPEEHAKLEKNLSRFANTLIANMLAFIREARKSKKSAEMSIDEIRHYISNNFHQFLLMAISANQ